MKTLRSRKNFVLALAGLALAALPLAAWPPILGDLPTLAPEVPLPLVTNQSVLRIVGTWTCVLPEAACATGAAPTIEARVQIVTGQGIEKDGTIFAPIPDKSNPGRYYINTTFSLQNISAVAGSGVLNLVITDDGTGGTRPARGAWVLAVMVEDKSPNPLFAPYISLLAEPRPDPMLGTGWPRRLF